VNWPAFVVGTLLILFILWDAFETVVLPRSIVRKLRLTWLYYRATWTPFAALARRCPFASVRERLLAVYGPFALIGLGALWALGLCFGFALLYWADGSHLSTRLGRPGFGHDLYMSGTTLFTLGLGDVVPESRLARGLAVVEAGTGFAFLAMLITYLPVLYQSFSRREVRLTLLDAWAGSPPCGSEVLRRLAREGQLSSLEEFLRDWEYWCSDILESHISYPAIAYFRSQHQRQSWVAALTAVLDLSALTASGVLAIATFRARLAFAMARHAAVDLSQVLSARPDHDADRLPPGELERVRRDLEEEGLRPDRSPEAERRLAAMRRSYEPYVAGLSRHLSMPLPSWRREAEARDNWQTSPKRDGDGHF
jgi:hypothetical protein